MSAVTVGRIVHYQLSEGDVAAIDQKYPRVTSADAARRNPVKVGDVCAAVVVAVFSESCANLRVLLDGTDTYWATSRSEGTAPGSWAWPPRV